MPRYIAKIDNFYLEWSTVVDAPVTFGMALDEFKEYYRQKHGEIGMTGLADRLARVEQKGVSSHLDGSVESLFAYNRAGPNETCLSTNQIKRAYCDRLPIVVKNHTWDSANGKWIEPKK